MRRKLKLRGFTLVELMVVIAVVAILVALALPSYGRYIRKANRGEAQQLLLNWANNQEIWRANETLYAKSGDLTPPSHDKYNFILRQTADNPPTAADCGAPTDPSATEYTLLACPKPGDQTKDEERGEPCNPISLNQSNLKLPEECW